MRQRDLLREVEDLKPQFERLKNLKQAARNEKYKGYFVNLKILWEGFLEELGELLTASFSKDAPEYMDDRRDKIIEELVDLSNQIDFLYCYLISAPRYLRAGERHHRMPNGKLVET